MNVIYVLDIKCQQFLLFKMRIKNKRNDVYKIMYTNNITGYGWNTCVNSPYTIKIMLNTCIELYYNLFIKLIYFNSGMY